MSSRRTPRDLDDDTEVHSPTESSRRRFVQSLGTGAVLGLAGSTAPASAQDGDGDPESAPPAPEQLEVLNRLDTSVQLVWEPVQRAESYEVSVDGEPEYTTPETFVDLQSLEPETTYEIAVAAETEDGTLSERTTVTVTTAPSADAYPVTVDTRIDPDRTDGEGRPGVVIEVSNLPPDAQLEGYQLWVETSGGAHTAFTDLYSWLDGVDHDGPMEPLTFGRLGTHEAGRIKGTAADEPPTAADGPVELVTVFHESVESTSDSIPFDVELETLVGLDGGDSHVPWDVYDSGVDSWNFSIVHAGEPMDGPSVSVDTEAGDGDEVHVTVTGTHEFPRTGCDTIYPRRVEYSDALDRFGVSLDTAARHEGDPTLDEGDLDCGDSTELVGYELTAVLDAVPGRTIVDERFVDDDRTVHYLDEEPGPELAPEVTDYDLSIDGGLGHDGSVEADPEIEFADDQLIVTGAVSGSNTCYTVAVDRLDFGDLANHDFRIDVGSTYREDYMPGDGCGAAEVQLEYELVVTFEDALPPHVTVDENGERSVGATNPDDGPRLRGGIDGYEFETAYASDGDLDPEPAATFDGDTVTLRGSREYATTGCRAPAPEFLAFDEEAGRAGVVVSDVEVGEACAEAESTVVYELVLDLSSDATACVVETQFEEPTREVYYADGDGSIDLPSVVADYELTIGDSVSPTEAAEVEPSVTFDGDDAIVEGALTYGSSSCNEIAVTNVGRIADDGQLGVDVGARRRPTSMPFQPCTADVSAAAYELELTAAEGERIHDLSVSEDGLRASHSVSASRDDSELPAGIEAVDLRVGDDADDVAVEPPGPATAFTEDTFVAHGDYFAIGSSSCKTVGLDRLEFASDARRHLAVTVADVEDDDRDPDEDCTTDWATTRYTLEVTFSDDLPRTVYFEEHDADSAHSRVFDRGREPVDLPDGVTDYEFDIRTDASAPVAEPRVDFRDGAIEVRAALRYTGSTCRETGLLDVAYRADDTDHLTVDVGTVFGAGQSPFGLCSEDIVVEKYTVELDVEDLPDAVAVEERAPGMAETVTVERGTDCASSATVDGQTVCDVDGDGDYRDVTGDGSVTNSDVTEFFANQHAPAWDERTDLFDFTGDGEVSQADVIALFESVA